MKANATITQAELDQRNAEHVPRYWMLITPDEAHELAEGRIPEQVQQMAQWLDTDTLLPWKDADE